MNDYRYEQLIERLREHGYRLTPQRMATIRIMVESTEHLSAAQIYAELHERFPTTSLATVYKTLAVLMEMGEVLELHGEGGEVHYDVLNPHPHPHLICVRCHRIIDAEADEALLAAQQAVTQKLAEAMGYEMLGYRFDVYGLCPACRKAIGESG